MLIVSATAHCPESGVKMKAAEPAMAVLIVAGVHVPLIPLVEVSGNAGAMLFWQSGPIAVNSGVTSFVITMLIVSAIAHCPESGVKM